MKLALVMAVALVLSSNCLADSFVFDEKTATLSGSWVLAPNANAYEQDRLFAESSESQTATCQWDILLSEGYYQLWAYLGSGDSAWSKRAPYTVIDASSATRILINQIYSPIDWYPVSEAIYLRGWTTVVLSNDTREANALVMADAIRLTQVPEPASWIVLLSGALSAIGLKRRLR